MRHAVSFDAEGTQLQGCLYLPEGTSASERVPVIVAAHGWGAVKEMYLDAYAEAFADAGLAVLAYDHRNFGASGGLPRQEIDPWAQVRDYRHAISYASQWDAIDPQRVGIWGTSYSAGHALVVAAIDRRVRCVVAQCPTISGFRNTERRYPGTGLAELRARFEADRRARYAGHAPTMVPIVPNQLTGSPGQRGHEHAGAVGNSGADWFNAIDAARLSNWRNEITLRSLEFYSEYEPGGYIRRIAPTPLLVITAANDSLTPTDEILVAYAEASHPKRLIVIAGGHYDIYESGRAQGTEAARDWFVQHLLPA